MKVPCRGSVWCRPVTNKTHWQGKEQRSTSDASDNAISLRNVSPPVVDSDGFRPGMRSARIMAFTPTSAAHAPSIDSSDKREQESILHEAESLPARQG
jgi:hypothetical protein